MHNKYMEDRTLFTEFSVIRDRIASMMFIRSPVPKLEKLLTKAIICTFNFDHHIGEIGIWKLGKARTRWWFN